MKSLILFLMVATVLFLGAWLAHKQRSKRGAVMTSPEWKTKQRAFQYEQRVKGRG